jgi:hypothetical protein
MFLRLSKRIYVKKNVKFIRYSHISRFVAVFQTFYIYLELVEEAEAARITGVTWTIRIIKNIFKFGAQFDISRLSQRQITVVLRLKFLRYIQGVR